MTDDEAKRMFERDAATGNLARGRCVFCTGEIVFPRKLVNGYPYVMHSTPYCETYDRLAPMDFMRALAEKVKGTLS